METHTTLEPGTLGLKRGRYLQEMGWSGVLPTPGVSPCFVPSSPPALPPLPPLAPVPLTSLTWQSSGLISITAKPVRGSGGPPGPGPSLGVSEGDTSGSELLPRLELMAQFRGALTFWRKNTIGRVGEGVREGWEEGRRGREKCGGKGRRRRTEERNRNYQAGTGRAESTLNTVGGGRSRERKGVGGETGPST